MEELTVPDQPIRREKKTEADVHVLSFEITHAADHVHNKIMTGERRRFCDELTRSGRRGWR